MPESVLAAEVAGTLTTEASNAHSTIEKLFGGFSLSKLLAAVILLVACIIVSKILLKMTEKILGRSKTDATLHAFIHSTVKILLIFVSIMLLAGTLGIDTSSLLAVFGMLGLAVSLSVQDSLSNIVSGIMILTTKPFKVGDYVSIAGQDGVVSKVGLLHTVLYTLDNQRIHVPNSQITAGKIVNCTGVEKRRVDLTVSASYDDDTEAVIAALKAAADHPARLKDEEIFARLSGYGDNSIEYTIRVWTTPENYWTVYFDVLENVRKEFAAAGISMSYPHVNVHMLEK
ncbi:MAG: mechanosensitive ion channel family protein [Clostridia bacterium]|nr:mechanosensitive ion channel family protein [Clostridia bacterium]